MKNKQIFRGNIGKISGENFTEFQMRNKHNYRCDINNISGKKYTHVQARNFSTINILRKGF